MHAARRLAALVALAVVAFVGCSEEPEPRFAEPDGSPSTTGDASQAPDDPVPTSDDPTTSSGASEPTTAQGRLVVEFIDAISTGLATGDASRIDALSSSECRVCQDITSMLREAYGEGGRIEGADWTVVRQRLRGSTSQGGQLWFADVKTTEERWIDSAGNEYRTVRGGIQYLAIDVSAGSNPVVQNIRFREDP